ncbi:hypothetical protein GCM10023078_36540 [Gibbsiella greigii]
MKFIFKQSLFLLLSVLIVALAVVALFLDIHWLHNDVKELSITEVSQELILAVIVGINVFQAVRHKEKTRISVLIAGFFGCMLIREMDFLFDAIAFGSWVWFALAVAALSLFLGLKKTAEAVNQLAVFMRHPAYGMMFSGLLCILIFSRLFGMHILWQQLMQDGYIRVVKNAVEEGTELFGYLLCLMSTCWYLATNRQTDRRG